MAVAISFVLGICVGYILGTVRHYFFTRKAHKKQIDDLTKSFLDDLGDTENPSPEFTQEMEELLLRMGAEEDETRSYLDKITRVEDTLNEMNDIMQQEQDVIAAIQQPNKGVLHSRHKSTLAMTLRELEVSKLKCLKDLKDLGIPKTLNVLSPDGELTEITIDKAIEIVEDQIMTMNKTMGEVEESKSSTKDSPKRHLKIVKDEGDELFPIQ